VVKLLDVTLVEPIAQEVREIHHDLVEDLPLDAKAETVVVRITQILLLDDGSRCGAELAIPAQAGSRRRHQRICAIREWIGKTRLGRPLDRRQRKRILLEARIGNHIVQIDSALDVYRRLDGVTRVSETQRRAVIQTVGDPEARQETRLWRPIRAAAP